MAYGTVATPAKASPLDVRLYGLPPRARTSADAAAIVVVPFDAARGEAPPKELEDALRSDFNDELAKGVTYPQRGPMSEEDFRGYFLSADLIVGIVVSEREAEQLLAQAHSKSRKIEEADALGVSLGNTLDKTLVVSTRDWKTELGFSYYVKPNYPGRSSHLCNAGFVVPPSQRGRGLGSVAGRSFLHYGPGCGYRGSIFNLVYANNVASLQIWERLGFEKVGRIPGAGLLRKQQRLTDEPLVPPASSAAQATDEEEYVDAWVIYGDFAKLSRQGRAAEPNVVESAGR